MRAIAPHAAASRVVHAARSRRAYDFLRSASRRVSLSWVKVAGLRAARQEFPLTTSGETTMQARMINTLAIALAAVLLSPLALAQDQQATTGAQDTTTSVHENSTARQPMTPLNSDMSISTFHHLDTNHDGHVTLAEARADSSFNSRFATLDADGNGYISQNELKAPASTGKGAMGSDSSTTTYGNADDSNYESGTSDTTTTTDSTTTTPPKDQDSDDDNPQTP
jgi:hypothetical protein